MVRVIPVVLVLAVAACSSGPTDADPSAGSESAAAPAAAPPAGTVPDDDPALGTLPLAGGPGTAAPASAVAPVPAELPAVVARVNGDEISRSDVEKAVRALERSVGSPVPATERDRVYRGVVNDLINYRLLLQESRRRKIAVTDAAVAERFESLRSQYPTQAAFDNMLTQQQLTAEQARTDVRDQLIVAKLLESEIVPKAKVNAGDVSAFYQENPSEFLMPRQVRASHVLVATPPDADAATRRAARDRAAGLLARARAGEDFAALAKEFSQDPGSASKGGDLGFFREGEMVGPFNDAAFSLQPGAISDLVETEYGVHIIKVLEAQPSRPVPLEEARGKIEQYLQDRSRRDHTQAFVQALRTMGKIDVYI